MSHLLNSTLSMSDPAICADWNFYRIALLLNVVRCGAGRGLVVRQLTPFPPNVPFIRKGPGWTEFLHTVVLSAFHADAIGRILVAKAIGTAGKRSCMYCIHAGTPRQHGHGVCFLGYSEPQHYEGGLGDRFAGDPALRLTHEDIMHGKQIVQAAILEGGGVHDKKVNKKVTSCND